MDVRLEVTSGPVREKTFTFEEAGGFIFGRARDCTFVTRKDKTFSRHHFIIEVNPPNVTLKDLGSLNGTYVNGTKYGGRPESVAPEDAESSEPVPLKHGDQIRAGKYRLQVFINAPLLCVDCGQEIPREDEETARFVGGAYLCSVCRTKSSARDTVERGTGRPRDGKISMEQRERAEDDPAAVIDEVLGSFLEGNEEERPPAIRGYTEMEKIGEGSFGVVYAATRVEDGQRVALKTMLQTRKPPKRQLLMFEREKEISIQLRHQHIVHCERASIWGEIHFIEMEYMEGGTVWDLIQQQGKLSVEQAAPIMLDALNGLAYAHKAILELDLSTGRKEVTGVVHRDLKPRNLLLSNDVDERVTKISDFGLAKTFAEAGMTRGSVTVVGGYAGTLGYMAPEHVTNYRYLKPVTDVFEIAATFYHMLTGHMVWQFRPGTEPLRVILEDKIIPVREREPDVPKGLADTIDRALSRDPDKRYQDAERFLFSMRDELSLGSAEPALADR